MLLSYRHKKVLYYTILFLLGTLCFLIYLLYRPDDILINSYLLHAFPRLTELKLYVNESLPLNDFFVYNFPSGLWIFSLTVLLKNLRLTLFSYQLHLSVLPLLLGLSLELLQLVNITDGTFDFLDVYTMLVFASCAVLLHKVRWIKFESEKAIPILATIGIVILFLGNKF